MPSLYERLAAVENTRGMDSADIELCDTIAKNCQYQKDGLITKRELFDYILVAHKEWSLI